MHKFVKLALPKLKIFVDKEQRLDAVVRTV